MEEVETNYLITRLRTRPACAEDSGLGAPPHCMTLLYLALRRMGPARPAILCIASCTSTSTTDSRDELLCYNLVFSESALLRCVSAPAPIAMLVGFVDTSVRVRAATWR